jgi:hypothetical protein
MMSWGSKMWGFGLMDAHLAFMAEELGVVYNLLEHRTPFTSLGSESIELLGRRLEPLLAENASLEVTTGT